MADPRQTVDSAAPTARAGSNVAEFSVSELSVKLRRSIEQAFDHVRVRGEVGRVSRPGSGHLYLDLKDQNAVLSGVVWKGVANRLKILPEMGLEVIVTGKLTTFPGQSKYQIIIEQVEPAGAGALMALLEERKKKLSAEGLFAEDRKRPLPFLPRTVGIITSPTGAVIRDMMHGFHERCPVHVVVWPVRVQGDSCAKEVARAVAGFNALPTDEADAAVARRPDVLIVARGGGSIEDLWGFNEEVVARAIAESEIPVISAVGHETDWTIADLVADARAPTPTKAAEWAVPKQTELLARLREIGGRACTALQRRLAHDLQRLRAAARGLPAGQDLVLTRRQRLDMATLRVRELARGAIQGRRQALLRAGGQLSPRTVRAGLASQSRHLEMLQGRAVQAMRQRAVTQRTAVRTAAGRLAPERFERQLMQCRRELERAWSGLCRTSQTRTQAARQTLNRNADLLRTLSHKSVLERGFALVRTGAEGATGAGALVSSAAEARRAGRVVVEFADGHADMQTLSPRAPQLRPAHPDADAGDSGGGPDVAAPGAASDADPGPLHAAAEPATARRQATPRRKAKPRNPRDDQKSLF